MAEEDLSVPGCGRDDQAEDFTRKDFIFMEAGLWRTDNGEHQKISFLARIEL